MKSEKPASVMQVGRVSVFAALQEAYKEAGLAPLLPPITTRELVSMAENHLTWKNSLFGEFKVRVNGFELGEMDSEGEAIWATVWFDSQPQKIEIDISVKPIEGVSVLRYQGPGGENTKEIADEFAFLDVDVEWVLPAKRAVQGDNTRVPMMRQAHQDNLDIVFVRPDGMFAKVEIGAKVLAGKFWVVVQEMFCGQIVRTTRENAAKIEVMSVPDGAHSVLAVPLYAENANPGSDYVKTFGPAVINHALSRGAVVPMHKATVAEWQPYPTELPLGWEKNGWEPATVLFFNSAWLAGAGFAQCKDGKNAFLHWKNIIDENGGSVVNRGGFPFLQRMTAIAVKLEEDPETGKRKATAIRKI